jgi:hypothetical protein
MTDLADWIFFGNFPSEYSHLDGGMLVVEPVQQTTWKEETTLSPGGVDTRDDFAMYPGRATMFFDIARQIRPDRPFTGFNVSYTATRLAVVSIGDLNYSASPFFHAQTLPDAFEVFQAVLYTNPVAYAFHRNGQQRRVSDVVQLDYRILEKEKTLVSARYCELCPV